MLTRPANSEKWLRQEGAGSIEIATGLPQGDTARLAIKARRGDFRVDYRAGLCPYEG
jgi:hypothetical protein